MDCFSTYFTHVEICDNVRVKSATQWTASVHTLHINVQTCNNVRAQSASVHTLHMSKSVITDNEALFVGVAASGEGSSRSMGFLPCSGDLSWNHCDWHMIAGIGAP